MASSSPARAIAPAALAALAVLAMCGAGDRGYGQSQPIPADAMVRVDAQTKMVINGALKYLAGQQHLDGSWSAREGIAGHAVAMTGYTLLAFMATGNLPDEGEYKRNVAAGTQFLLDSIAPDGTFRNVSTGQYMYNHAIATVALAELYGESHSPVIRPRLERALSVIIAAQNSTGGWRYTTSSKDADISVTVLQSVALRAAQDAGLFVPEDAIDRAIAYVRSCYQPAKGGFSYQPGGPPGFARTAAAIYSLQVLGKYDDPMVKAGSAYLFSNLRDRQYWTYGNYYAAPAQYMIGGETWRSWYAQVKTQLLAAVLEQGDTYYWDLKLDGNGVGPVFTTAVYVHILAMPYHFVPLYQR
jgi:prenyltransferase beta subunit